MLSLRVILSFLVALFLVQYQSGVYTMAADKKVTKQDLVDKWQGIFGDKIDFSDEPLFDCMVYLGPQPISQFQDFGDKKLAGALVDRSSEWMEAFFKPEYRPDVRKSRPSKYYLPQGQEPGLLYY